MARHLEGTGGVANVNPWQARLGKALKGKPGDLLEARQRCWFGVCVAAERIAMTTDSEEQRKWVLALSQIVGVYGKLHEVGEFEPRLKALEALLEARGER
jgi:hypothetical protein